LRIEALGGIDSIRDNEKHLRLSGFQNLVESESKFANDPCDEQYKKENHNCNSFVQCCLATNKHALVESPSLREINRNHPIGALLTSWDGVCFRVSRPQFRVIRWHFDRLGRTTIEAATASFTLCAVKYWKTVLDIVAQFACIIWALPFTCPTFQAGQTVKNWFGERVIPDKSPSRCKFP
jgi:hypothetical protein